MILRILLVNDDGYEARGLTDLAITLSRDHEITVVAPELNCSGFSNAITIHKPVAITRVTPPIDSHQKKSNYKFPIYKVSGTPVDCAYLALHTIYEGCPPDFVISGINEGENLAEDTLYSGTVAGAMEGFLRGIPSIAISQKILQKGKNSFLLSAELFGIIFRNINIHNEELFLDKSPFLLNINFPYFTGKDDMPTEIEFTHLGRREDPQRPEEIKKNSHSSRKYFLVGAHGNPPEKLTPGTDLYAISHRKISVTSLQVDLTNYKNLLTNKSSFSKNIHKDIVDINFSQGYYG